MLLLALDDEEEEEEKENFEVETLDEREEMGNANGKREKEAKQFPNPRGQLSKRQGREMRACSKFTRAEKKGSEIGAINLTIKFPRETKLYPRQTYTVQRVVPSLNENEK